MKAGNNPREWLRGFLPEAISVENQKQYELKVDGHIVRLQVKVDCRCPVKYFAESTCTPLPGL
eukprot:m.56586 g.56586  ORF g.56586 m.56586 type:complete len:63 (-) comp15585_c0_seq1:76-264(-)